MFYKMLVSFSHCFHFTTLNIKLCCNCARVETVAEDEEIKFNKHFGYAKLH